MENKENIIKKIERLIEKTDALKSELAEIKSEIVKSDFSNTGKTISHQISEIPTAQTFQNLTKEEKPIVDETPGKAELNTILEEPIYSANSKTVLPKETPNISQPVKGKGDFEKFIGENLINKIGIAVLVIGIGFFIKYAIDQNWLNEYGRVIIGALAGFALIGIAFRMREGFRAFSSVLGGGGIAVLYFSVTIAFREYAVLPQEVAFVCLFLITALCVYLSVLFDRIEFGIIGALGGFASPLLISTGMGNYIVLFNYLLILNGGILVLAYIKNWNILNLLCYLLTVIFFGSWLITRVIVSHHDSYLGALLFASAFYVVFFMMNIIYNIRQKRTFGPFEIVMISSNTFLFYLAGMLILNCVNDGQYQGIFTGLTAIYNLVFAFFLFKNKNADRILVYLLIGFTMAFVSLTAPAQLHGNFITMFWACEMVLFFWLSNKPGLKILRYGSFFLMLITCISLFSDWMINYFTFTHSLADSMLPVIINKSMLSGIFVLAAFFVLIFFVNRMKDDETIIFDISKKIYKTMLVVIFIAILYFGNLFELVYQLSKRIEYSSFSTLVIYSYHALFFALLMLYVRKFANTFFITFCSIISCLICFIYPFTSHIATVKLRNGLIFNNSDYLGAYLYHYINVLLIIALFVVLFIVIKEKGGYKSILHNIYMWFMIVLLLFVVSMELNHAMLTSFVNSGISFGKTINNTVKIGWPILWSSASFILMIIGMKHHFRMVRLISLSILLITLIKLFTYDIISVPAAGKIAAFIILGILLLVISFMYQKLKKIFLDGENEK